ncbi:MAG TPA: type VI secretion system baseplate subunit TssE [Gammaproteobacteria bacterium]|jgi:type VI secretion system lysozyme-like protein|nr:type VI secretion system baseplate subunit TssE [Gammaproteobacteria bacterium]
MSEERLFKRLRRWSAGGATGIDVGGYVESVLQDLGRLYNTRRGSTPLSSLYGLPDISNMLANLTPPDVEHIREAIETTTREFEPRMQGTKVSLPGEESLGVLRFAVQADLLYEKTRIALRYQVNIEGDGRVSVRQ